MGLWSFLRGLWPRRTRGPTERPPPAELPAADGGRRLPEAAPPENLSAADEEQVDEDEGWEDEDEPDAPDPFISASPAQLETLGPGLEQRRAEARAAAIAAEHLIYLSMPAGPGSLAEALNQLSAEGMVEAEFVDDGQGEPHIVYRPAQRDRR
jgi:hypothetical protein